jgi:hypothetical protein
MMWSLGRTRTPLDRSVVAGLVGHPVNMVLVPVRTECCLLGQTSDAIESRMAYIKELGARSSARTVHVSKPAVLQRDWMRRFDAKH